MDKPKKLTRKIAERFEKQDSGEKRSPRPRIVKVLTDEPEHERRRAERNTDPERRKGNDRKEKRFESSENGNEKRRKENKEYGKKESGRKAFKENRDEKDKDDRKPYRSKNPGKTTGDRPAPWKKDKDSQKGPDRDKDERRPYRSKGPGKTAGDRPAPWKKDRDSRNGPDRDKDERRPYRSKGPGKTTGDKPAPWKKDRDFAKGPGRDKDDRRPFRPKDPAKPEGDKKAPWKKERDSGSNNRKSTGKPGKYPVSDREKNDAKPGTEHHGRHSDDKRRRTRTTEEKPILIRSWKKEENPGTESGEKPSKGIRLNKFIANAGICSRREADVLIETGVISINGQIVTTLGTRVMPGDEVKYGDQVLHGEKIRYILLNKPKGYITTTEDESGRKTVMEIIGNACRERLYPVGRLDRNTTGLLLLTNDGTLAKKLTHPSHGVKKLYHAELDKTVSRSDMEKLTSGIELEDGFVKIDSVDYEGESKKEVGIEIHSGKNRVIRRIFEHLGYEVVKLDRVMFANLTKKDLPRGKWRFLNAEEINILKRIR